MIYDFDNVPERRGTSSLKYDFPVRRGKPEDVLPLWVADMDFPAPPCVLEALAERVKHGIFGYSEPDQAYLDTLQTWFGERFGWNIDPQWLIPTPGVVNAIYLAAKAFTAPGDGIVIQQPVYPPFEASVVQTGRHLLVNELVSDGEKYGIDFADFESKIKQSKMFVLCSPHNPVGRVWTRDELEQMGHICLRHGVVVISDEIHQDFVFPGHRHLVFADLDPRFADITITCTSPSKTFNLAGLQLSNIFISKKALRDKFTEAYEDCGLSQPPVMGLVSCQAAYAGGAPWLDELLIYLEGNMDHIGEFLRTRVNKIKTIKPDGTYLAWLDFRDFNLSPDELDDLVANKAKLWLNSGPSFGAGGAGFLRMNTACPNSIVHEALERLERVFADR